jgi:hypothetical protein
MQLRLAIYLAILLVPAAPAAGCSLVLGLGGTLALSPDATRLASDEAGGLAKTVTIANLTLEDATISVGAPTLYEHPAGFDAPGASVAISYSSLLSGGLHAYTSGASSFSIGALTVATILTVHSRITSPAGFAAGTYRTRTVLTCS